MLSPAVFLAQLIIDLSLSQHAISLYQENVSSARNLLAIPVGIKQKINVDTIVQKVHQFINAQYSRNYNSSLIFEMLLWELFLPDIHEFSFFQRILQSFYSIMMEKWMDGWILSGVARPYILLLRTKQNGRLTTLFEFLKILLW